ncbi:tail length tape measure protein [Streptomyces phage Celia]|uniref:Tape measure protein n=1 Tax=Streptomyces phage Celia TaxID=2590946 RepID=A0A516KRA1_9CAUD|nr:tail length tape measure protein [Streptomyces phage Celia]QDP44221.1 tape measure protein [Streptomyces phage Celia]QFG10481.1 tape measure protein [Streptomyces phage Urza]QJD50583.1 tape measure protein [Streptomyces phage Itza]
MPAGQVIGRVSVKVLPDTDDFRRQAQNALDKIEKTLKLEVPTTIDMSGASKGYLEELKKINARNRASDARKIRFYTMISTDGMNEAVRKAVRQLQDRAKSNKVKFQVDDLDTAKVKIELDLDQAARDHGKRQLDDWADDVSPVKVRIEPDLSAIGSRLTSARLAVLTRPRTVSIIPELNNAAVAKVATALAALSGARVLNNMFKRLGDTLKNLDKTVPIIGSLATAVAGLAGWGLTAASNLFALSQSLAQIGPLALLLPGLLGGMAVGLGVTIAAFKDFNKVLPEVKQQLSRLQDTISENFWKHAAEPIREMVDELLPEFSAGVAKTATQLGQFFGSFATSLKGALNPALTQMFDDLSKSIDIATTGTGAFANIIAVLGKVGTSYLPQLAQWFVDISTRFSDFLSAAESDGRLKGWIDQGLVQLKALGSVLYNLGGIFAGVARAAEEAGGSTLTMLASTLESIHKTVDSPGFQRGLVDVFRAAHEAMSNIADKAGPAVKNLFIELGQLLTDVLPQVGEIIGTALDAVASALAQPAITEGVKAVFDGIQTAVEALAPAMAPLGQALGALMQVIGTFAAMLGPLVAAALVPLSNILVAIAPHVQTLIQLLGGALTQVVQQLAPIITGLANSISGGLGGGISGATPLLNSLKEGFTGLMSAVGPLVAAIGQGLAAILPPLVMLLGQVLAAVMPLVTTLVTALTPIFPILGEAIGQVVSALQPFIAKVLEIVSAVLTPLIEMLSPIIQEYLPKLSDAITRVVEALQPFLDALLAVVNFLMPILVPILEFIISLLLDSLVNAINGVGLVLEGLVEIFQGAWDLIVGILKIAWGLIVGIFTGNFDTLVSGWNQFWSGLWTFLKGIWDTIIGALEVFFNVGILGAAGKMFKALKAAWTAGWTAIKTFVTGLWNTLKGLWSSFGSSLGSLGSSMMSSLRGLISSGWNAVKGVFTSAWNALKSAVTTGVSNCISVVRQLPGKAKDALSNLGSTLVSAGKSLIQGFINGIKSMFGSVKSKLGDLTSSLTSWKGPESLDRVLLVDAGKLVINGFIKGLESRYDAVKKSLRGLTEDVASTSFEAPTIGAVRAAAGVASTLSSALSATASEGGGVTKVLNYYAAEGSSISAEEDLFAAANRARMGW